jgi:hypothetical protein
MGLYGSVLLHLLGNTEKKIAPAVRLIWKINFSNIALPGRTILEVYFLEIENFCSMTQVRIYGEI